MRIKIRPILFGCQGLPGTGSPLGIFAAMSIISRILGNPSKKTKQESEQRGQFVAPSRFAAFLGLGTKAGVSVSEEGAMALSAVYSCVRLIASSIASLDLHLHRVDGSLREVANDHPV